MNTAVETTQSKASSERRDATRIREGHLVYCPQASLQMPLMMDISEGGMKLSFRKPMPIGKDLSLFVNTGSSGELRLRGRVVWTESVDHRHFVGVKFHEMRPETRTSLQERIRIWSGLNDFMDELSAN